MGYNFSAHLHGFHFQPRLPPFQGSSCRGCLALEILWGTQDRADQRSPRDDEIGVWSLFRPFVQAPGPSPGVHRAGADSSEKAGVTALFLLITGENLLTTPP